MKNNNGLTDLMKAAQGWNEGDLEEVVKLLKAGADVNQADDNGATALSWAACKGQLEILGKLLDAGANVNQASKVGMTTMMHAAREGYEEIVAELLKRGADVNQVDDDGNTALSWTIRGHSQLNVRMGDIVDLLLKAGADIDHINSSGSTALNVAAHNGNKEAVNKLLDEGASSSLVVFDNIKDPDCAALIRKEYIIFKISTKQPILHEERAFLPTAKLTFLEKYIEDNKDLVTVYLKTKAKQITNKVIKKHHISDQETKFLDSREFSEYNPTLLNLFHKNGDLTSRAISSKLSKDAMTHIIDFLPTKEVFDLQNYWINLGMKELLTNNYQIQVEGKTRSLSSEEVQINNFESDKIIQLYREIIKNPGKIISFESAETISLSTLLEKYTMVESVSGVEESKESASQNEIQDQQEVVGVFAFHDLHYDNPFLNNPELVLRALKLGTTAFNHLLNVSKRSLDQGIDLLINLERAKEKSDSRQMELYAKIIDNNKLVVEKILAEEQSTKDNIIQVVSNIESDQLFTAIDHKDLDKIQNLVLMSQSLVNATNSAGNSALSMATILGHNQIANYLLAQGAYAPEYELNPETFDLKLPDFNPLNIGNLDQEREEVQFHWNLMHENNMLYTPLLGLGILTWLIADHKAL